MKITKIKKGLVLVTLASGALAIGCELIVDFDRTKIPVETTEASVPDSSVAETGTQPTPEAGADADAATSVDAADAGDGALEDDGATDASDSG